MGTLVEAAASLPSPASRPASPPPLPAPPSGAASVVTTFQRSLSPGALASALASSTGGAPLSSGVEPDSNAASTPGAPALLGAEEEELHPAAVAHVAADASAIAPPARNQSLFIRSSFL